MKIDTQYTYTTKACIIYDCIFEDAHFKKAHSLSEYVKIAKTAMKRYNFSLADIVDEETGEILAQLTSVS